MNLKQLTNEVNNTYYTNNSYKVITSKCKELLELIGASTNIKKINTVRINQYIQQLKQKDNKPATINSKLAYLSKCLTYAYHNGYIPYKPLIAHIKIQATKDVILSDDIIDKMILYTQENNLQELYKVIVIGINTGMRISNILSTVPSDIDNNYIRIYHNKTNKPYSIPLNDKLKELFKDYQPITLNYRQIQYQFKTMVKSLNLDERITIHTLRHTTASKLIQKDIPLPVIQKILNHTSINTTMRYTHICNKQLESAVNVL